MCLDLTTVGNGDKLGGSAAAATNALDSLNKIHSFNNFAEHAVLAIEPWAIHSGNEELHRIRIIHQSMIEKLLSNLTNLRAVGVWTSVCHG